MNIMCPYCVHEMTEPEIDHGPNEGRTPEPDDLITCPGCGEEEYSKLWFDCFPDGTVKRRIRPHREDR